MTGKRIWQAVQVAFFVVAVAYFVHALTRDWDQFASLSATLHPDWWMVAASGAWVLASYVVLIETWRQIVTAWGGHLSWGTAARIWFISNLGRYVPGKVWQIGAMGVLSEKAGVSGVAAVGSSLVVNVVNILAGFLVVAVAGSRNLVASPAAFVAAISVFCAAVIASPWLLPPLARLAQRVTGRNVPVPAIPPLAIVFAVAGCAVAWNLYGIAFRDLDVALFGVAAGRTSAYTAVFILSYLMGYIAVFAPGGIGVREGVLLTLLAAAGLETGAQGETLVIVSRLWLTVIEAAPGLILLAVSRPKSFHSTTEKNAP
jgi:uncharacterized membrane protein YbhN (UPF0104 family)